MHEQVELQRSTPVAIARTAAAADRAEALVVLQALDRDDAVRLDGDETAGA